MAQFTPETIIRIADNMFYLLLVIIITEQIKNIVKNFNKKNDDTSEHP
jgi:hypothetical protein